MGNELRYDNIRQVFESFLLFKGDRFGSLRFRVFAWLFFFQVVNVKLGNEIFLDICSCAFVFTHSTHSPFTTLSIRENVDDAM